MQTPKPSLLVITMLAALVAQSHAAVEPALSREHWLS